MAPIRNPSAPFRFRDLPTEVQIQIFHLFRPAEPPRPTTEASQDALIEWAQQPHPSRSGLFKYEPPWGRQARDLLLINKSTFRDFAPHYYQSIAIRSCDPLKFANDYLSNTTDACLYNLRYVSFVLPVIFMEDREVLKHHLQKMSEVIELWAELRRLNRFEYVYVALDKVVVTAVKDTKTAIWNDLDFLKDEGFSRLERRALATTFKGFTSTRDVKLEGTHCPEAGVFVANISITFTRNHDRFSRPWANKFLGRSWAVCLLMARGTGMG